MKRFFTFCMLIAIFVVASPAALFGQILKEGTAPALRYGLADPELIYDFTPMVDWAVIDREDALDQKQGMPMRAGFAVIVGKSINEFGEWMQMPDGKMLWRATLKAEGASGLGVVFDQFELPEGAEIYIYNEGRTMVNGALGHHNNNAAQLLSTQVLYGSSITIEYIEAPSFNQGMKDSETGERRLSSLLADANTFRSSALLRVGELMFMYRDVYSVFDGSKPNTGASGPCQIDINCAVGNNWQNQKRGVAHTLNKIGNSWYYCTGSLINNTLQNGAPLFLSAEHCGQGASAADRNQWQFYFNYERPDCGSGTPVTTNVITGCELLASAATAGGSDFLLVLLNNEMPLSYYPFYNGWYRENVAATSGASIHHPSGDVKKISTFSAALTSATPTISGSIMATNAAWRVVWSANESGWGVTEGGSSGSPLFNQNGRLVGTLTGGSSSCTNQTAADFYGKFSYHWESNGSTADRQLKPWLDPLGASPASLNGWDPQWLPDEPPVANFSASATTVSAGTEITFTDLSTNGPAEWLWDFGSEAFPQTSTQRNPKVTWATSGTYSVSLTVSNAYGSNTETKMGYVNITGLPSLPGTNPVVIGTGTDTSLYPFGIDGRVPGAANQVRSVGLFTSAEIGGGGLINKLEWYANTSQEDTRNIKIWLKHTNSAALSSGVFENYTNGATLVYEGTFVPSPAGWVPIGLTNNFVFNGSDNLLVIVYVWSTSTANISSNVRYAPANNRHHRWNSRNTEPTGNGTVDSNRPNIRISFQELSPPVSNFAGLNTFFSEDFEGEIFPPSGWTINNQDGGGVTWASSTANNYTPGGSKSAYHNWGASGYAETGWLITPQINLPEDQEYVLTFWSKNLDADYYGKNSVYISTSATTPGSFTDLVWQPESVSGDWEQSIVNLSAYAGQNIYIGFRYEGTYAHGWHLDDVSLAALSYDPITVYEGVPAYLFDRSTNHPSLWEWITPGAEPSLQYDQNISLVYFQAGLYDVGLKAANPAGTGTETKTGFVNVLGRAPLADFAAKGNLKTINYQPFIPKGASVDFFDESLRVPTSWNWTFDGGNPMASGAQNPSSTYYVDGIYDVSLSASNNHGADDMIKSEFVKVGGTDNVTNLFPSDVLTGYNVTSGQIPGHGQITSGSTTYRFYQWAEYFSNQYEVTIDAVRLRVRSAIGAGKDLTIAIWKEENGAPGALLGSKTVLITSLSPDAYNVVSMDSPIALNEAFFVGFELSYDASHNYSTNQFSILTATNRGSEKVHLSTAWLKYGTTTSNAIWAPLNQVLNLETSMAIEPRVSYVPSFISWHGTEDNVWTNSNNWSNGVPETGQNILINSTPNNPVLATTANIGNLAIAPDASLTIAPTGQVTVSGDLINEAGLSGLVIGSDAAGTGSLIHNAENVVATVNRNITGGWESWDAGWHLISSPVAEQAISEFIPGSGGYDFYGWDEASNTWINYKGTTFSTWNGGTNFNPGQGYLISFEETQTKSFAGALSTFDHEAANLALTSGPHSGWHLLGNPFASALQWNNGSWNLSNINSTAKIWHEVNKSYSDIEPEGIIPSAQGFMVQVIDAVGGSLRIPSSARTHSNLPWLKGGEGQKISLVAYEQNNRSAQESNILVNPESTEAFHSYYDARFLPGYAPAFYSLKEQEKLSTFTIPALYEELVIPLGFERNDAGSFRIELNETIEGTNLYLFDRKLNLEHPLRAESAYGFTSDSGDEPLRFELRFSPAGATGISSLSGGWAHIYVWNNALYLRFSQEDPNRLLQIYDLSGRMVLSDYLDHGLIHTRLLHLEQGIYFVRVSSQAGVTTQRVFVK